MPKHLDNAGEETDHTFHRSVRLDNQTVTTFRALQQQQLVTASDVEMSTPRFSRGDWVKMKIQTMPNYDGLYQINAAGEMEIPFSDPLLAAGLDRRNLIRALQSSLLRQGWFHDDQTMLDVSLVRASSIQVTVFGAVFSQGQVTINGQPATKPQDTVQHETGSFTTGRNLAAALRAAGGIRPDADLRNVILKRHGVFYLLNIHNLVDGEHYQTVPTLIQGDEIYVASRGEEDTHLIRPTSITPPGMRVLMSNLTAPALSNAQSAISTDATRLAYGASLLDAAISANCIGGTHNANASRSILLITRHHGSTQQVVIRRSINQLLANASDYAVNPYLMPDDGVACYDSRFTNLRDVARGVGELFGPILLGGIL
ncbi:polysaccharide export outer membrane protein [Arenicella chitinivorans]|uniref:Polysaccharide export outer membrane protein n=2 Tax=Arenicella chitinivorans TaxID=1329800 RepID=A0A918VGL0_9GAMM|nr:polysaccharide export outer membrane protein [Arenicella chitinivorans]